MLLVQAVKLMEILFENVAIMKEPNAPIPAASVGVATPAIIEPKTTKINKKGGNSVLIRFVF